MRSSKRSIASRYRAPSPRRTSPSSSPRGAPARGEPSRPSTSEARRPTQKRARVRRMIPRMIPRRGTGSLVVRWFPLTTWIWSFCGTWRRPRRSRASPAVAKAAEACLAGYRAFARFLAAFDNELGRAGSGGSGGRGCVTVSNVRYAGACARVASPSVRVAARLETLADAFPPGDFFSASGLIPGRGVTVRTTGARERLIDWRAMLDGCGPSAALLAQEKAAGSAVGGVVSLRACVASAAPGPHLPHRSARRSRRESRRRRRPRFDRDAEAVAASSPRTCSSASARCVVAWSSRTSATRGF